MTAKARAMSPGQIVRRVAAQQASALPPCQVIVPTRDVRMIVAALASRAQNFERAAGRAVTLAGYEIARRAAERHRALAARVAAAMPDSEGVG